MIGMSCLILLAAEACLRGVLAPEAGGVEPAELSEDLFSTEQRRLRSPILEGEGDSDFDSCRCGSGFCLASTSGASGGFAAGSGS